MHVIILVREVCNMDKYELILSKERYYYYDMVHHISELYSGALPGGHTFTKSMIDGIIINEINNGIDEKLITDGVIGETKIHSYPIIHENGNCYEYENEEYLDVDYSITFLSTKQVIEYMKLRVERKKFDPPLDFKKYFLCMNITDSTNNMMNYTGSQTEQEKTPISQQYCFTKTNQSWDLRYGEVHLPGMKDLVGMSYIKLLLQNPNVPIGVIEIQAMLNAPLNTGTTGYDYQEEPAPTTKNNGIESSRAKSMDDYKNRLKQLSQEREVLDREIDFMIIEDINNETDFIKAEIANILCSKDEDPEIKKNRDKVYNNIKAAKKNIKELELKIYGKTLLYNYLDLHIKTGNEYTYIPPAMTPPEWTF